MSQENEIIETGATVQILCTHQGITCDDLMIASLINSLLLS